MMIEDMYVDYSDVHLVFGESYANIEVIMSIKEYKKFKEMQKNMEEKYMIDMIETKKEMKKWKNIIKKEQKHIKE